MLFCSLSIPLSIGGKKRTKEGRGAKEGPWDKKKRGGETGTANNNNKIITKNERAARNDER